MGSGLSTNASLRSLLQLQLYDFFYQQEGSFCALISYIYIYSNSALLELDKPCGKDEGRENGGEF